MYDACALDELVGNRADAQEDVRPPVDLEVGDADDPCDEDVGGRCVTGAAEALEALGRDAVAGELLFEALPEMVRANLRDHGGASSKFGDVDGDVGRLAAEVADELPDGPKRNRELVRDEVHERLFDSEHVEGPLLRARRLHRPSRSSLSGYLPGAVFQTPAANATRSGPQGTSRDPASAAPCARRGDATGGPWERSWEATGRDPLPPVTFLAG